METREFVRDRCVHICGWFCVGRASECNRECEPFTAITYNERTVRFHRECTAHGDYLPGRFQGSECPMMVTECRARICLARDCASVQ